MMAIFGTGFAGFGIITRLREGVIERLRVTPVNRLALMLGMIAVDLVNLLAQTVLLVGIGWILGFRPNMGGLLLLLVLLLMSGLMMGSCSYAIALLLKNESALAATVNLFVLPLMLLSGIMLPLSLAPELLQRVAKANPFAYAVDAARALVAGSLGADVVIRAFVIFAVLALLALLWATQSIRKAAM
jgi:ABC-2 type transport system permease protein